MTRPPLTINISLNDFYAFYWLKEELVAFCRQNQIPTSGSKQVLCSRVAAVLSGKPLPSPPKQRGGGTMPTDFSHETIIGKNWRCSQALRFFLEQEIGSHFHFDSVIRDLIHISQGKTIGEVIHTWLESQKQPMQKSEIAPQFEYNRFIREYFQRHTKANFKDAITAWKIHKSSPKFKIETKREK